MRSYITIGDKVSVGNTLKRKMIIHLDYNYLEQVWRDEYLDDNEKQKMYRKKNKKRVK